MGHADVTRPHCAALLRRLQMQSAPNDGSGFKRLGIRIPRL